MRLDPSKLDSLVLNAHSESTSARGHTYARTHTRIHTQEYASEDVYEALERDAAVGVESWRKKREEAVVGEEEGGVGESEAEESCLDEEDSRDYAKYIRSAFNLQLKL